MSKFVIEGKQEFEVDKIVGHTVRHGQLYYLVSWVGYDASHN